MGLTGLSGLSGLSGEAGGGLWWLSGGVAKANCFGAYQGRHAGSYALSKINLNQPGTNDLVETGPPDWAVGVGWQGGATTQFFTIPGCRPTEVWSMLAQFKNAQSFSQQFAGAENQAALGPNGFSMNNTGSFQAMINFGEGDIGGVQVDGNLAMAGKRTFRDGVYSGITIPAGTGTCAVDLMLLCDNWNGVAHGGAHVTEVIAFAIYTVTLSDAQVAAIAAAMAGL